MKGYFKYILFIPVMIVLSCCRYFCGDGSYTCRSIISIDRFTNPVRFDEYEGSILFENGEFLFIGQESPDNLFSNFFLPDMCDDDSIRNVIFYDDYTKVRNLSNGFFTDDDIIYLPCFFILTSSKCCIWNGGNNISAEFGNTGQAEAIISNAVDGDIDLNGNIYILDGGNNTVKIYDFEGTFISSWPVTGNPQRLKLFNDNFYILDSESDRILKYEKDGGIVGPAISGDNLHNITAFSPATADSFWVADMGGTRIVNIGSSGEIVEEKYNCCYYDMDFEFQNVSEILFIPRMISYVMVLDKGKNSVFDLVELEWFCHLM